jgi:hypothetical protein
MALTGSSRSKRDTKRAKSSRARVGASAAQSARTRAARTRVVSVLLGLLAAATTAFACSKMPIAGTDFSLAEQVKCVAARAQAAAKHAHGIAALVMPGSQRSGAAATAAAARAAAPTGTKRAAASSAQRWSRR